MKILTQAFYGFLFCSAVALVTFVVGSLPNLVAADGYMESAK